MKGHNYGEIPCKKCGKEHKHPIKGKHIWNIYKHPRGMLGKSNPKGMLGKKHSENSKRKMSISRKIYYSKNDVWNKNKKCPKISEGKKKSYKNGTSIIHNKGKSKENYEPLRIVGEKRSQFMKENTQFGINNPNWQGGKSFLPYSEEFNME